MTQFLNGMAAMGFVVAGLFFCRFWRRTADILFGAFAVAFFLLAAHQAVAAMLDVTREEYSWTYLIRLLAFAIIIITVIGKNLAARGARES
jgi:hypothetical protein